MADSLWLGAAADDAEVSLPARALLRHVMALGSSGSGKTVFCKVITEAAAHAGIPALLIDPQGDLASLGSGALDREALREHGVPDALADDLAERLEVVVFTPGSNRGIPLSADPIDSKLASLEGEARVSAVTRTAAVVVALLGFDLESDDGAGLAAVVDQALHELLDAGGPASLAGLGEHLGRAEKDDGLSRFARYLDAKKIRTACQRLARLDVGARRALFHGGVPIDIDVLLGRDPRAPTAEGKTRVAVVYLNTLHNQEDKDFFVAALVDRLYAWMLAHPSPEPQALFYIDEVAPFIPPVRKPAAKEGLSLLFKQARKYGVCCLMATQNPGDVDYRAMAQFGTWALGRLTTRQDLKKIEPTVKSLAPDATDSLMARLPALSPGQFLLLSPDCFDDPVGLRARWLVTRHETWTEDQVAAHAAPHRARFDAIASDAAPEPTRSEEATPATDPEPARAEAERSEGRAAKAAAAASEETAPKGGTPKKKRSAAKTDAAKRSGASPLTPDGDLNEAQRALRDALIEALREGGAQSAKELTPKAKRSESAVRRGLARLVEEGLVETFRDGRSTRFWLLETGGRPDLRMPDRMAVFQAQIGLDDASELGASMARSKLLGLIGDDERFERAEPRHRLIYKLDFEERVERPLLGRLFGESHDDRVGSVYVHPHDLRIAVFTDSEGLRFEASPTGPASEVRDFDGVTRVELRAPGTLRFDDADWTERRSVEEVRASFLERFDAKVGDIDPLFVPLYVLYFANDSGSLRRVEVDALVGKPTRW